MAELITPGSRFYEVSVNWDKGKFCECDYKDYLVDNQEELFFIHLGLLINKTLRK